MSEYTLAKVRDIVVVNHERLALELSLKLRALKGAEQRTFFGGNRTSGYFYLFQAKGVSADTVLESVVSLKGDAITSLYKINRAFNTVGELMKLRDELVRAVAAKVGLSADAVGIDDEARGRTLGLVDLSTGQLIDLLAEKMGATILRTDSHAADASVLQGA